MKTSTYDFTDSVVLVTGGGTGIGQAIARAFLNAGAGVAVTGRRLERLERALEDYPAELTAAIAADVSDSQQVKTLVYDVFAAVRSARRRQQRRRLRERADHRAGRAGLDDDARRQHRRLLPLAKATLPHLAETEGNQVAVSSVSGERGDWGQAAYNATKAAITNFVRSLALDWGPTACGSTPLPPPSPSPS